jgi:VanZ family protein
VTAPVAVRAIAPLALMALIFYLSSRESVGPDLPAFTRVIAHFSEYALLTALWIWALAPSLGRRAFVAAAAISFLYAISDEFHQSSVAGRDADPLDVLVDVLGIAAATWLLRTRRAGERRSPTSR